VLAVMSCPALFVAVTVKLKEPVFDVLRAAPFATGPMQATIASPDEPLWQA
jgi:hypothetical protein